MKVTGKAMFLGGVVAFGLSLTAPGWSSEGYGYSGERWKDDDIPVPYYTYTGLAPPTGISLTTFVTATNTAFQKWEDVPTSYMEFIYRGETASYPTDVLDGRNVVGWTSGGAGGFLAYTSYWTLGNYLTETDIVLNRDKTWSAATPIPFAAYDLHTTLLHEAGHTLSLDDVYDSDYSDQVMYYALYNGETRRELGDGDKAGITFIYPKSAGDLVVSEVRGPPSGMERERIELSATVRNVGSSGTNSCELKFYLSIDSRLGPQDTFLGEEGIPALSGGERYEAAAQVSLPVVLAERDYHVLAFVDAEEQVQETSEDNNTNDYFPLKVWWDSDADGLPNWWEIAMSLDEHDATGRNGPTGDPDGDGLSNTEEYDNGTDAQLADTDNDGKSDYEEIMAGTDPTDHTSVFRIESIVTDGDGANQWITIRWQTVPGRSYQVHSQEEPGSAWTRVGPLRSGTGGSISQTEPLEAGASARYYRIEAE
jgi:hypothetical protein